MPRKKSVRKTSRRTKTSRAPKRAPKMMKGTARMKMMFALRKLIFFAILTIASILLMSLTESNEIFSNLFWLLEIIFGALTLAFLIVFLVFLIIDFLRRKA